jgi:hypothetical protein
MQNGVLYSLKPLLKTTEEYRLRNEHETLYSETSIRRLRRGVPKKNDGYGKAIDAGA